MGSIGESVFTRISEEDGVLLSLDEIGYALEYIHETFPDQVAVTGYRASEGIYIKHVDGYELRIDAQGNTMQNMSIGNPSSQALLNDLSHVSSELQWLAFLTGRFKPGPVIQTVRSVR